MSTDIASHKEGTVPAADCPLIFRALSTGFLYPDKKDELVSEYDFLFGSSGVAPLEIAFYLSKNPFEQAKKTAEIAGFYKAFGVEVKEGTRPDSLPALFELMSYLWLKVINAKEKGWRDKEEITHKAIRDLTSEFLKPGLEGFLKRLEGYGGFYHELGQVALEAINEM